MRSVCVPGRDAIMTTPSYGMIRRFVRIAGAELVEVPWWRGDFPVDAVLEPADDTTALVCVVSPNNPTGAVASRDDLPPAARGPARAPWSSSTTPTWISPTPSTTSRRWPSSYPNAVVVRTLSKAWGARRPAGRLRPRRSAGGGLAAPDRPPLPGVGAVAGHGERPCSPMATVPDRSGSRAIRRQRDDLAAAADRARRRGPAVAGRLRLRPVCRRAAGLDRARTPSASPSAPSTGGPTSKAGCASPCPGTRRDFARLAHALRTVLAPEALLFDMDGVLADVSGSYREAILATAAAFGVEITTQDIAGGQGRGQRQQRLGAHPPAAGRTGRGSSTRRGDRRVSRSSTRAARPNPVFAAPKRLLLTATSSRALGERFPLAVVTGRPRADAERFLAGARHRRLFPDRGHHGGRAGQARPGAGAPRPRTPRGRHAPGWWATPPTTCALPAAPACFRSGSSHPATTRSRPPLHSCGPAPPRVLTRPERDPGGPAMTTNRARAPSNATTSETRITLPPRTWTARGEVAVATGIGFLDHMLDRSRLPRRLGPGARVRRRSRGRRPPHRRGLRPGPRRGPRQGPRRPRRHRPLRQRLRPARRGPGAGRGRPVGSALAAGGPRSEARDAGRPGLRERRPRPALAGHRGALRPPRRRAARRQRPPPGRGRVQGDRPRPPPGGGAGRRGGVRSTKGTLGDGS